MPGPVRTSILDTIIGGIEGAFDAATGTNPVQSGIHAATVQAAQPVHPAPTKPMDTAAAYATKAITTPAILGLQAAEAAWSYGVARPASTAALLTSPKSPLYNDGFQFDDVTKAFNRSEQISFGQAAAANPLSKAVGALPFGVSTRLLAQVGGEYDPWSDTSMSAAHENPFYNFLTGLTDAGLQIVVPPAVKAARLAGMGKAGLRTTIKSAEDLDVMRNDYLAHRAFTDPAFTPPAGVTPKPTPVGAEVDFLAGEKRIGRIMTSDSVAQARGVDKYDLSNILANTDDKDTIFEILQGTRGDIVALKKLVTSAPDRVWEISDMRSSIQEAWMNGSRYHPSTPAEVTFVGQAFASAAARDKWFQSVKDLLVTAPDTEGLGLKLGSTWMPTRNMTVESLRQKIAGASYAAHSGDWSDAPRWLSIATKGTGSHPQTIFQWFSGKQPLGHVDMSGLRPNEYMVEFDAQSTSVPIFRGDRPIVIGIANDGVTPVTRGAAEQRALWQKRLIDASHTGSFEQVWRDIEGERLDIMAHTLGVNPAGVRKIADGFMASLSKAMTDLGETGYLFDEAGNKMDVHPATLRQMLSSFQALPMSEIYNAIRTDANGWLKVGEGAEGALVGLFDFGMKIFRTNVLFRPGYIGKNSIMEPALASGIAHASILTDEGFAAMMGNLRKNTANKLKRVGYQFELNRVAKRVVGKAPGPSRRRLQNELNDLIGERYNAHAVRDELMAERDLIMAGDKGPTYRAYHGDEMTARMVDAQHRIESIEAQMDDAMPEWRQVVEPASLADVRAALRGYKPMLSDPSVSASIKVEIERLQGLYDDAARTATTPMQSPLEKIQALDEKIEALNKRIGIKHAALGAEQEKLANVTGLKGFHGSGSGPMTMRIGGEDIPIDGPMSEGARNHGMAIRSQASAAHTARMTLDPSYRAGHETARWKRTNGMYEIGHMDETYWDEKAWAANAHMRGDRLWQQIIDDVPRAKIAEWFKTAEGKQYSRSMGRNYLQPLGGDSLWNAPTELDEAIRLARQYFPEQSVRDILKTRDITPAELRKLQGESENLSRIAGSDLVFNAPGTGTAAVGLFNKALDRIWYLMTAFPEDRLWRWPFYTREFKHQMQQRGGLLASQGVRMNTAEFASFRQASHRVALNEMEKTFYNIRRYSTPVYATRFIMAFPGAFFNSLYRYGRFATKEPERVFMANLFAADIVKNGGVDAEGNPVKNIADAKYILIPGTAALGERLGSPQGLKVPVGNLLSTGINAPSPSFPIPIATSIWIGMNPTNETSNVGQVLTSEQLTPFGVNRNPIGGMFAAWQKDAWRLRHDTPVVGGVIKALPEWLGGGPDDVDMVKTSVQMLANSLAEWDKAGGNGPEPTIEDALRDARAYYAVDMLMKFGDSYSTQHPVPGQMMRDAWNQTRAQYGADTTGARDAFMKQYGDWAKWYTYSSSDYSAYLPATADAYNRVFTDFPELTKSIVSKSGDDPSMVSLLALGTAGGPFSQSVYDYYRDNPLPGDNVPIAGKLGPEKWKAQVDIQQGREEYSRQLAVVNSTLTQLRAKRDQPGVSAETKEIVRNQITAVTAGWAAQVANLEAANEPWALSRTEGFTDRPERAARTLDMILADPKFASTVAKEPIWVTVSTFLDARKKVLAAKASIPSTGYKHPNGSTRLNHEDAVNLVKNTFTDYVLQNIIPSNPDFQPVWDSYFADEWSTQ